MISVVFWWPFFFWLPAFPRTGTVCQWCHHVNTAADACDLVRPLMSNFALEILAVDLNALGFGFKAYM